MSANFVLQTKTTLPHKATAQCMDGYTCSTFTSLLSSCSPPALSPRPRPHLDPWKWRWSWSTWMKKSKMRSGPIPPVLMWRNAGWVSTTATLLPLASTLPPPTSATVREDTQEMALCTATRRKSPRLQMCCSVHSSFSSLSGLL